MNSFPIFFLFISGSATPSSSFIKSALSSAYIKGILILFLNISKTSFSSYFLRKPWFTKIQVSCLLIALWSKVAVTVLSTPPEIPQITLSFLTISFISLLLWEPPLSIIIRWFLYFSSMNFLIKETILSEFIPPFS